MRVLVGVVLVLLCSLQTIFASQENVNKVYVNLAAISIGLQGFQLPYAEISFGALVPVMADTIALFSNTDPKLTDAEVTDPSQINFFISVTTRMYEFLAKIAETEDHYTTHRVLVFGVLAQMHARLFVAWRADTQSYKGYVAATTVQSFLIPPDPMEGELDDDNDEEDSDTDDYPLTIDSITKLHLYHLTSFLSYIDTPTSPNPQYQAIQKDLKNTMVLCWANIVILMDYVLLGSQNDDFTRTNFNYAYFGNGATYYLRQLQNFLTRYEDSSYNVLNQYIVDMRTEHFDPDFVLSGPNDPIRNRLTYLIPEQFVYLITPKPAFNGNNF